MEHGEAYMIGILFGVVIAVLILRCLPKRKPKRKSYINIFLIQEDFEQLVRGQAIDKSGTDDVVSIVLNDIGYGEMIRLINKASDEGANLKKDS